MTMSSTLVHGTRLRNCWLTRGDLENVSPPSQGQFSPEPGGGGDVHLLSSYYEHPVFNIYPKLVHTLKTWSNAIILQNWQNTFSCRDQIEVKFSPWWNKMRSACGNTSVTGRHPQDLSHHYQELFHCHSSASRLQKNIFSCSKDFHCVNQINHDLVSLNLKYLSFSVKNNFAAPCGSK